MTTFMYTLFTRTFYSSAILILGVFIARKRSYVLIGTYGGLPKVRLPGSWTPDAINRNSALRLFYLTIAIEPRLMDTDRRMTIPWTRSRPA